MAREPNFNFRVYITLTASPDPLVGEYRQFVRDAVLHFQPLGVGTYSLWNEPNAKVSLHASNAPARASLYRSLYVAGYDAAKQASKDLKLKAAKVLIGELSSYKTGYTADRFLRAVAASGQLKTDGVAWHPYGNRVHADKKTVMSIQRIGPVQGAIDKLWSDKDSNGKRLLVTPKGRRPALLFTEFGYLNLPYLGFKPGRKGNNYWHTEARRAGLYRDALNLAYRPRASSGRAIRPARWMVLYQATEIPPSEFGPPGTTPGQDYGVMSRLAEITGNRGYGKHPAADNDYQKIDAPSPRLAYCAIRRWAAAPAQGYPVAPNECP